MEADLQPLDRGKRLPCRNTCPMEIGLRQGVAAPMVARGVGNDPVQYRMQAGVAYPAPGRSHQAEDHPGQCRVDAGRIHRCPDAEAYREGHLTPVFFGSALRSFGVGALLDFLAAHAPGPRAQPAEPRPIEPDEAGTTGFVFKVQANMDPQHRDRIAFVRLCSGRFRRGMRLTPTRTGRALAVQNPIFFFAQDRELAEEAHPGDIIGIPNHGTLRVGETLTEGEPIRFTGLPDFAPEILRRVRLADPMKAKQMRKGLEDLAEEGVVQVLRPVIGADWIVGVVGQLQLDVLESRMMAEYGVKIALETAPAEAARWIAGARDDVARFVERHRSAIAEDRDGDPVFLAPSRWQLNRAIEEWPALRFGATKERH